MHIYIYIYIYIYVYIYIYINKENIGNKSEYYKTIIIKCEFNK